MSSYHRQSGFGLTESLIALVILSVGLLALNGVHTQFILSLSEENYRSQALMLTSKRLDEFRMDAADKTFDESDGSGNDVYDTLLDQTWTVSGSNPATVTVTTSWSEDVADSVSLSTLISKLTPVTLSFQGQEVGSGGGSSSQPPNEPPVAEDDSASVTQNQSGSTNSVDITVKENDSDTETTNENLGVIDSVAPSNGVLTLTDGVFTYTPNDDFKGVDTFTYLLSDGDGGVDSATVTITVLAVSEGEGEGEGEGTEGGGAGEAGSCQIEVGNIKIPENKPYTKKYTEFTWTITNSSLNNVNVVVTGGTLTYVANATSFKIDNPKDASKDVSVTVTADNCLDFTETYKTTN